MTYLRPRSCKPVPTAVVSPTCLLCLWFVAFWTDSFNITCSAWTIHLSCHTTATTAHWTLWMSKIYYNGITILYPPQVILKSWIVILNPTYFYKFMNDNTFRHDIGLLVFLVEKWIRHYLSRQDTRSVFELCTFHARIQEVLSEGVQLRQRFCLPFSS